LVDGIETHRISRAEFRVRAKLGTARRQILRARGRKQRKHRQDGELGTSDTQKTQLDLYVYGGD